MTELDPMPDDLRALLASERDVGPAPADGKARVRARALATIAAGGGGGPSGSSPSPAPSDRVGEPSAPRQAPASTALSRLAMTFVLGAAVGGAVVYGFLPPKIVEHRVEVSVEAPRVSAPRVDRAVAPEPSASASASPSAPSAAASVAAPPDSLSAERAVLDPARAALGRGDAASALAAVKSHEQRYPRGQLVAEREAIATQALVLAGRKEEARARGQRFLARYPGNVLVPMVEAAIEAAQ